MHIPEFISKVVIHIDGRRSVFTEIAFENGRFDATEGINDRSPLHAQIVERHGTDPLDACGDFHVGNVHRIGKRIIGDAHRAFENGIAFARSACGIAICLVSAALKALIHRHTVTEKDRVFGIHRDFGKVQTAHKGADAHLRKACGQVRRRQPCAEEDAFAHHLDVGQVDFRERRTVVEHHRIHRSDVRHAHFAQYFIVIENVVAQLFDVRHGYFFECFAFGERIGIDDFDARHIHAFEQRHAAERIRRNKGRRRQNEFGKTAYAERAVEDVFDVFKRNVRQGRAGDKREGIDRPHRRRHVHRFEHAVVVHRRRIRRHERKGVGTDIFDAFFDRHRFKPAAEREGEGIPDFERTGNGDLGQIVAVRERALAQFFQI